MQANIAQKTNIKGDNKRVHLQIKGLLANHLKRMNRAHLILILHLRGPILLHPPSLAQRKKGTYKNNLTFLKPELFQILLLERQLWRILLPLKHHKVRWLLRLHNSPRLILDYQFTKTIPFRWLVIPNPLFLLKRHLSINILLHTFPLVLLLLESIKYPALLA